MKCFILLSLVCIAFASLLPTTARPRRIVGGWQEAKGEGESVRRIAESANKKLSENGENEIVKICHAKTQVVAGINYDISMLIKSKGSSDDSTNQYCEIKAYERRWEDYLEIGKLSCDKNRKDCSK